MRSVLNPAKLGTTAPTRIVCLPGAYQAAQEFLDAGFDASLRRRNLSIDLVLVDVELEHLTDRRTRSQLHEDIVLPARAEGCRALWFAGISLGGYIALDYAAWHVNDLNGVCLLAPYLGNRGALVRIDRGPDAGALDADELRISRFLRAQAHDSRFLYLGFGVDDRFAAAHRLMARDLPKDVVDVVPGGHDWRTWRALWDNFLDATFR